MTGLLCAASLWAQNPAGSPVATHGLLKTKGNRIVGDADTAVSMGGNSLFWSQWGGQYYNATTVQWLNDDWHAKIIRAAMAVDETGGYIKNPTIEKQKVINVVDACIAQGLYVIIDWHSHHAEKYKTESIAFFQEMATKYGQYPNVIYEVYNEPLDTASWSQKIKPYAVEVIGEIRKIDPDNLILVGTRTWSQEVVEAANDPINDNNTAYVLHFYVGSHGQYLRDKAKKALDMGLPLFVSEWGLWGSDAELDKWMVFMRDNKLNWCNWSIMNKDEPPSSLKPTTKTLSGWTKDDLTTIGKKVRNYMLNWPQWEPYVAEPCTLVAEPYTTLSLPGIIEAEFFDKGCNEASYFDVDESNQGGKLRTTDGVDIEVCTDAGGGYNIGYTEKDEWLQYSIAIKETSTYTGTVRVASKTGGGGFKLQLDGKDITPEIAVPATGDWQKWGDVTFDNISLTQQDVAKLRFVITKAGFNFNKISLQSETTGLADEQASLSVQLYPTVSTNSFTLKCTQTITNLSVYHITGALLSEDKNIGTGINFGHSLVAGSYLVVAQLADGTLIKRSVLKQ